MPEFPHVPHALRTPTRCVACETNRSEAGFLDLVREIPGYGRLYLCASCVEQAGVKVGCLSAKVAGEMRQTADDDRAEIGRLEAQLVFEREHKTISANDLAAFVGGGLGAGTWTHFPDGITTTAPLDAVSRQPEDVDVGKASIVDRGAALAYDPKTHDLCPECDRPKRKQSKTCHDCYIAAARKPVGSTA